MRTKMVWFTACAVILFAAAAWATKVCPNCGREYPDSAKYCNYCEPRTPVVPAPSPAPKTKATLIYFTSSG